MAGSFAKIYNTVWADQDFRSLDPIQQWLFFTLISQPELSFAGVLTVDPRRLAGCSETFTLEQLYATLASLEVRRYVFYDEGHGEILVRSYIRHDGAWRTPNTFKSILRDVSVIRSPKLRAVLRGELERLPVAGLQGAKADEMRAALLRVVETLPPTLPGCVPQPLGDGLADGLGRPLGEGLAQPIAQPIAQPTVVVAVVGGEVEDRTSVEHQEPFSSEASPHDEDDDAEDDHEGDSGDKGGDGQHDLSPDLVAAIDRICEHLAQRIIANGSKPPTVGKKWRDAARLMMTADGRTEQQIRAAIDWCQADEFWRGNVLSLPTLRAKYDQLRLQATAKQSRASPRQAAPPTTSPRDRWMERE